MRLGACKHLENDLEQEPWGNTLQALTSGLEPGPSNPLLPSIDKALESKSRLLLVGQGFALGLVTVGSSTLVHSKNLQLKPIVASDQGATLQTIQTLKLRQLCRIVPYT